MMKIVIAALGAALLPCVAFAQTYVETDAGQTLTTASDTTTPATGVPLTTIAGTLTSDDADLYRIYIGAPSAFFASTNNAFTNDSYPGGGQLDTALFLFSATGTAIGTNDDADGFHLTSTLSASNPLLSTLAIGYYYLGISISGNEPVNSANQLLFNGFPSGDTTATRGAASGLNPTTLATFDKYDYDDTPGAYQISLAGVTAGPRSVIAAVPEPATWAMTILGFGAVGFGMRRRQKARTRISYTA